MRSVVNPVAIEVLAVMVKEKRIALQIIVAKVLTGDEVVTVANVDKTCALPLLAAAADLSLVYSISIVQSL